MLPAFLDLLTTLIGEPLTDRLLQGRAGQLADRAGHRQVPAGALQDVFDRFVQEARATVVNRSGLGIGLAVVRELVEAHGGSVVAASRGSDLGSEFSVTLPLLAPL